jgi:drug/metabolite transporter superfamily protein YnfA
MPCLIALFALIAPRLLIAILWLFTHFFAGLFASALWPILGFIFLPTTLIWFAVVQHWFGGTWDGAGQIIGLVVALMIDVSPAGGKRKRN